MGEWRQAPDGKTRWWDGEAWGAELKEDAPAEEARQSEPEPVEANQAAPVARKPKSRLGIYLQAAVHAFGLVKLIAAVVLIVVIAWIVVSCATRGATNTTRNDTISLPTAQRVCETATKQQLKAPDTAKFTWEKKTETSDTTAHLEGYVSSENSFGALIATDVTCEATYDKSTTEVQARAKLAE